MNTDARVFRLKVITWNVGAKSPPGDLERLLIPDQQPSQQPSLHHIPNVYAIWSVYLAYTPYATFLLQLTVNIQLLIFTIIPHVYYSFTN